jgi:hypothetical protein
VGVFENGTFTMQDGTISGNTAQGGGGVYLGNIAGVVFTKNGGTIDATNSARTGSAILVITDRATSVTRDNAAGPDVNLDSRKAGSMEGWE